ncbi:hypothetical protein PINS_up003860 [Pythium insidiosum]|nr:hypothetical protein PINS_up003860 [Pythium insidiosum]
MWSRDMIRVLHGAGKVAEQLAKTQVPALTERSSQLARHANELARILPYLMETSTQHHAVAPDMTAPPTAAPDTASSSPTRSSDAQRETTHVVHQHPIAQAPSSAPAAKPALVADHVRRDFDRKRHQHSEIPHVDPHANVASVTTIARLPHSRLLRVC